nr:MAG: hypothetical protein 2 [Guangxi cystovirus 2]
MKSNVLLLTTMEGSEKQKLDFSHTVENMNEVHTVGGLCAGLKTSVLLFDVATNSCIGRCESAGVRKGSHQIVLCFDRTLFRTYICKFAQPNSHIVLENSGSVLNYRLGVNDGA